MSTFSPRTQELRRNFDVSGYVTIVSGANRGNGYAIAKGLEEAGANVVRIDISFDSSMDADDWEFDLSNTSEIPDLVNQIFSKHGRIDALVNNAGISLPSSDPYADIHVYDETLAVNLHGAFALCSAICPIMASHSAGAIVNVTSLGAELGFPDNPSYQVSKAGLRQLTKAIARDWGAKGIRANNLCPGYIRTAMTEKSHADSILHDERKNRTMLNRWGESADLAGPAIFLISEAAAYITGSDIYVDGGWTAKGL